MWMSSSSRLLTLVVLLGALACLPLPLVAWGQAAPEPTVTPSVTVVVGVLALAASWAGVMFAILRFAMSVGQLTTTVEHLKTSLEGLSAKFDSLQAATAKVDIHENQIKHMETELAALRDIHGDVHTRMVRLESTTVYGSSAGRRATGGGEG